MKRLLPLTLFSSLIYAYDSIDLQYNANGKLIMSETESAFVAGNGDSAYLQKVDLKSKQATQLVLPENPIMYSLGKLANLKGPQAFVLTEQGIFHAGTTKARKMLNANSLFKAGTYSQFKYQTFTLDANGDDLTDFYLPGVKAQTVYVQQVGGQFTPITLPLSAKTVTHATEKQLMVSHTLPQFPTLADINGDGINDLMFHEPKSIQYFLATSQGPSKERKTLFTIDNNSKQHIERLRDFNNDGLPDIHVIESLSEGADKEKDLDSESIHRIFFSKQMSNGLVFKNSPDIELTLEETSAIANISDFDGDGLNDLAVISFDIGFMDIISIASAAMENEEVILDSTISIFKGKANNQFSKKAASKKSVEIAMNMSESSDATGKGIIFKDFNGDDLTDLLIRSDTHELKVYFGDEKRGLSRRPKRIKRLLPESSGDIYSYDLNQDGKEEIVLKVNDKKEGFRVEAIHISKN
ncbi:VCBS repeat-containing protein [Pseudoalteromonas luteoviolacea]|uniref:FG-GAP repeat domain-containing protein n=1 Tax=Pseudoalteromonas luteoviolacea TaxID=43657 RepID=UPI001B3770E7|nr:VCBS repeat-containing protein [Pseudoalteromonas luteoviolacea]MBQ4811510.1 VCBS repeat-containing protein [Pseudoalteromonas luteoviolacea]